MKTTISFTTQELNQHFAWCQQLCRRSGSSFFTSFRLLDPPRRQAMFALYAFARITDDLGDNPSPAADRLRRLDAWQGRLQALVEIDHNRSGSQIATAPCGPCPELDEFEPLWLPLAETVRQFSIPLHLLTAIVEGVRRDIHPRPPADWSELEDYCYHVASAVGLACVHIWKQSPADNDDNDFPAQAAIECGLAFQLTNILRDVAEDARHGRLYLPLCELEKHRISQAAWLAGTPDGDWCGLISEVASRAEEYYQRGWSTVQHLTPRSRRMFSLMWCTYRSLLQRVVSRRQQLWQSPRIGLPSVQRACLLATHLFLPPAVAHHRWLSHTPRHSAAKHA